MLHTCLYISSRNSRGKQDRVPRGVRLVDADMQGSLAGLRVRDLGADPSLLVDITEDVGFLRFGWGFV